MNREYLVLTHAGTPIDPNLLEKGLYAAATPTLYTLGTTIAGMVEHGRYLKSTGACAFLADSYFDNLAKCTLTKVTLSLVP